MARLYPYDILFGSPLLEIAEPRLLTLDKSNSTPLPEEDISSENRMITLWPESDLPWAIFSFKLHADLSATNAVRMKGPLSVSAVVDCRPLQLRKAVKLKQNKEGTWEGEMSLSRNVFSGTAVLKCVIGSEEDGVPRFIGETHEWKLYFEEAQSRIPRGALDSTWVHFRTDEDRPGLRKYDTEMFFLDLERGEPKVLLNADLDGLRELLAEPPKLTGVRRAVALPVAMNIAKSVYSSLIYAALSDFGAKNDGEEPDWPTVPWKQNILKMVLPQLYPHHEEAAMLSEVYDAYRDGRLDSLIAEASAVVSSKLMKEGRKLGQELRKLNFD